MKHNKEVTQVTATRIQPETLRVLRHLAVEEGTSVAALLGRLATRYVADNRQKVERYLNT
ncbi:hypothetical protein LDP08_15870 [Ralstonia pseudosolanacearum]|uniref:hypothetical protein n=1 Tax=Ralstonia pseudosolanacearum TaxID=1310165 RepID=UPI003CEB58FD